MRRLCDLTYAYPARAQQRADITRWDMLTTFFAVDVPIGRLATMAAPACCDRLDAQMSALRAAGVAVLVSALTREEYAYLKLAGEEGAARAAGCEFIAFPITDRGVPDHLPAALAVADEIAAHMRAGRFVVTHCWGGIGRSTLLAAAAM